MHTKSLVVALIKDKLLPPDLQHFCSISENICSTFDEQIQRKLLTSEGQITSQNSVRDFCDFEITWFFSVIFCDFSDF